MALSREDSKKMDAVVAILKEAESVFFVTGAGVSADSGLPTYRGIGGLYEAKATEEGFPIEMALAGEMLKSRPEVTWKYLAQIEGCLRHAAHNRAHEIMAEMEKVFGRVWILTQNIDGFHRAAGSKNVIDIHGDIHRIFCVHCGWRSVIKDFSEITIPPLCPTCGRIVRPDVVFFGEMLAEEKLAALFNELRHGFDIYFSIGTTSVFPYIQQPIVDAKARRKPTVEINPGTTAVSDIVDIKLMCGAAAALEEIWERFRK